MTIDELNKIANLPKEERKKMNISWYGDMWKQMHLDYYKSNEDGLFFDAGTVILVLSKSVQNAYIAAAHMETMIYA